MIVACVPNLMDRSRFGGADVVFIDSPADAIDASLVIVDLDRCDEADGFAALPGHTVGFGAHVDAERIAAATLAGFGEALARSAFFRRLPDLLREHGAGSTETR